MKTYNALLVVGAVLAGLGLLVVFNCCCRGKSGARPRPPCLCARLEPY